jgi:hypothetical protein
LYDTYTIGAAALTSLSNMFFSTPISGTKTKNETNMSNAGVLPSPQVFRCFGIKAEAYVTKNTDITILAKLCMDSYIRFFVGTKDYITIPFGAISGKVYQVIDGLNSTAGADQALSSFGAPSAAGYKLPKNGFIDILSLENFGVEWILNTSVTLNANLDIKIYLEGFRGVEVR